MEFWGIEVKGKEASKVKIEDYHLLHLSQAVLDDAKKGAEPVTLYVKVGDKKLVLGMLSPETNPQLSFDLVFEQDFEISHNSKNGSVHLLGYLSERPLDEEIFSGPSDEDEEDLQTDLPNGEAAVKMDVPKVIAAKPIKDDKSKVEAKAEDEDDDSDDDEDSDDDDSDEDMADMSDDSDDDEGSEDDEESSEEEETPVKVESGKKRKPKAKTPEPKKAKLATPQKTDGKKNAHTATPYPAKKGGKTPPGANKSAPKSGAPQSNKKAKKSGGK